MQRSLLMRAVLAATVLSAAAPATAAADTIIGQLVDNGCNMTMGKTAAVLAPDHLKCAIACAQKGGRLAVVTAKGDVYAVTGALTQSDNAKLVPFVNQTVVVTGTLGVIQAATAPAPPPPSKTAARRSAGTEDGVVAKTTFRTGDFREGDVPVGSELTIEAVSIDLAPAIKPVTP